MMAVCLSPSTYLHLSTIGSIKKTRTPICESSLTSDSLNYIILFFDFKQLLPAKNVEIPSGLLTESEKPKI